MKKMSLCTIGNCVHVAGVMNFSALAEREGYEVDFMGISLPIDDVIENVKCSDPDVIGLSYRLSPEPLEAILNELKEKLEKSDLKDKIWLFGGTEPTGKVAEKSGIFKKVFYGGEDVDEVISILRNKKLRVEETYPRDLISRINWKYPYPVLRHHIGLSSVEETVRAIDKISDSKVLDVISIAPDQNAQEYFFDQDKMDSRLDGAGGVPLRTKEDFSKLYEAAQKGNYPLMRCYSGTKNLIKYSEMLQETIHNAWCAVPLFWYSELDKRGPRKIKEAIRENQKVMKWHGQRNIPVEANESHHWSLRDAHDAVGVATAYLAAYNAKKMGVKDYISQYMFNVPASISPKMDLAKMLAMIELIENLEDENFRVYRQARAGLASFPTNLYQAKGQLASSAYLSMAIKPHIYHVVGYCEAHHAATADDIIESCMIVRGVLKNIFLGDINMVDDIDVQRRKAQLIKDGSIIINSIKSLSNSSKDPLTDPVILEEAVKIGILDAPHLKGNSAACGKLTTRIVNGGMYPFDEKLNRVITEGERIERIMAGDIDYEINIS
ncbi:cobalamin B12-binding domain-containing protein [Acidilutibacter cellobiosedens]|jgi:methylmalonyl-CoA mutase cobalamin-binding subunit|uniref:Cobalamin B12-binding domain-containing protein n=1 Tax=Acidilutibacter cellobiosedens TaxID=2507161 RepID=A0A410QF89_9FIRM|nr:cobalamin B12-binding domain-containing protein [Acidilutibacter cellobiosedens]MBE6082892.1 cobalamin B12-binding domain-containing protein [Tissierellaceae bacterium]QAT62579.1 cobalamin B12-binding domain-containing protein [Acidilutibacter cellobiosedens]